MKKAVIVIPTYNERENIQKVIPLLFKVFKEIKAWDMHILVVDDSSPDNTADAVRDFEKKYDNVHLLLNKQKAGLGGAYLKGLAKAFGEMGAEVAFEFDADLSHDPTKIPEFLRQIENGADLVLGSRYVKGGGIPSNWGLHRKFLSVIGNIIIMIVLTDFRIHDWTGGYRAITKPVYDAVHKDLSSERFMGYTFQIGFLHKAVKKGFKVTEVPFKFVDREIGESKLGMEYIKNILIYIFKTRAKELMSHRVTKFVVVGGIGALIQLSSLYLWRQAVSSYVFASFLAIETAIVSNFLLNNYWTFAEKQAKISQFPVKFFQFNLASAGSIAIQTLIAFLGKTFVGLFPLFTLPLIGLVIDTGMVYAVIGILVGMFWNFFAYTNLIWKKAS